MCQRPGHPNPQKAPRIKTRYNAVRVELCPAGAANWQSKHMRSNSDKGEGRMGAHAAGARGRVKSKGHMYVARERHTVGGGGRR